MNKKWVLVFDQINRLFARPELNKSVDLGTLPFSFRLINSIMKGDRIVSIISASTNNEIAYRESHRGFVEYDHPCQMNLAEIELAFNEVAIRNDGKEILKVTGGVPLQVRNLISFNFSIANYEKGELCSILFSLGKLHDTKTELEYKGITASAVGCILSNTGHAMYYDRKYLIPGKREGFTRHYEPLFPLVLVAYQTFFWEDILEYVETHEASLLLICANLSTTNDTRGRIFEFLVIKHCSTNANVTFLKGFSALKKCNLIETFPPKSAFPSNVLPEIMNENGMYVPRNSNFPAIDLIWKCGDSVCGVQVHVSKHHNVLKKFTEMCKKAGWLTKFKTIYLLYLSPEQSVANSVQNLIPKTQGRITVVALCKSSIPCLKTLQWPKPMK